MMETRTVIIQAAAGLHDRWAAYFVQKANEFQSDIYICFGSLRLNAKSLMGIMGCPDCVLQKCKFPVSGDEEEIRES